VRLHNIRRFFPRGMESISSKRLVSAGPRHQHPGNLRFGWNKSRSLQLRVLGFSFSQDRDIGVSIFP